MPACFRLPLRHAGQGFLKDLCGDLHRADLAAAGADSARPGGRAAAGSRRSSAPWDAAPSSHRSAGPGGDPGPAQAGPGCRRRSGPAVRHRTHLLRCRAPGRRPSRRGRRRSCSMFLAMVTYLPSCLSVAEAAGLFQREADLQVLVVDHQPDGSLPRLATHPVEEVPQRRHLLFDRWLARIALDDDRLVEQELAALGVVAPDASALREGGRPAEERAQDVQRLLDPEPLIDGLVVTILAGDEQDQQGRGGLAGTEGTGEIGHEDLRFFIRQSPTFCPESQAAISPMLAPDPETWYVTLSRDGRPELVKEEPESPRAHRHNCTQSFLAISLPSWRR